MKTINHLLNSFSFKYDKKIRDICSPLSTHLGIAYFFYMFVEENGTYGLLTSDPLYNEFFFDSNLHQSMPFYAHPSFFRSGHTFIPCSYGENYEKAASDGPHPMDHLFMTMEATEKKMEAFFYANEDLTLNQLPYYLENLDMLTKFNAYFKREAASLIGHMQADGYSIIDEKGGSFFLAPKSTPLSVQNKNIERFLKEILNLTKREHLCLELFKQGKSAQAVASILNISQRTVEHHYDRIRDKLGVQSKWDLLNW